MVLVLKWGLHAHLPDIEEHGSIILHKFDHLLLERELLTIIIDRNNYIFYDEYDIERFSYVLLVYTFLACQDLFM